MQLEELKELGLNEQVAQKIEAAFNEKERLFEEQLAKNQSEQQQNILNLRRDYAVWKMLFQNGAINPKTVMPLLNLKDITMEGDQVHGLKEQIEKIREEASYLFSNSGTVVNSGPPHGNPLDSNAPLNLQQALQQHYK